IASAIAAAVEQQGAATREISRSIQQAADGTRDVSQNIAGVSDALSESGRLAEGLLGAASDLSRQADVMRTEISRFVERVRASSPANWGNPTMVRCSSAQARASEELNQGDMPWLKVK
ncbi:MAG: methyl-accepting chemotaxis protein, partial [Rhodospirillaceae bacterium]|nr:methyl-accepting chemotaxis protein [Rhodospirillaceae bacterium]